MASIILLHRDPLVIGRILNELTDFPILGVRSIYAVLNMISDPRYELLIAERSVIEPWLDCIEGQRPAMPIMVFDNDPVRDDWSRRSLRNAVIGLTDRPLLDYLASTSCAAQLLLSRASRAARIRRVLVPL
jgi:hypothetical protein